MQNRVFTIIIFILSILFSLVIIEFFLVFKNLNMKNYEVEMWKYAKNLKQISKNNVLGHEHIPNTSKKLQSVDININSLGFRGNNDFNLDGNKKKLLILGSSISLGWGVDEELIFSSLLQNKISDEYVVFNAGIGNYNARRYVELFLSKYKFLNPDIIIIQYFLNDSEKLYLKNSNWFLKNSQLAVLLWNVFNNFSYMNNSDTLLNYYKEIYDRKYIGFQEMQRSLEDITIYSKDSKVPIYFMITPDLNDLENYKYKFIHDIMEKEAIAKNLIFLDPLEEFLKKGKNIDFKVLEGDPHPNEEGHKILADFLYKNIFEDK